MAKFDQRGQQVVNQTNADTVNQVFSNSISGVSFTSVQDASQFTKELRNLIKEINQASQLGEIEKKIALEVEFQIKKAVLEAEEPQPKKQSIIENIDGAKKLLEGVTTAGKFVTTLIEAAKIVGGLFL